MSWFAELHDLYKKGSKHLWSYRVMEESKIERLKPKHYKTFPKP